jgi:hypothetical protein
MKPVLLPTSLHNHQPYSTPLDAKLWRAREATLHSSIVELLREGVCTIWTLLGSLLKLRGPRNGVPARATMDEIWGQAVCVLSPDWERLAWLSRL